MAADTEFYKLYYKEKDGARLLINITDKETINETNIIITRDKIIKCIKSQLGQIIASYTDPQNVGWNGATWQVHQINNIQIDDIETAVIDLSKPLASVLFTYPNTPYFRRIELWLQPIKINTF